MQLALLRSSGGRCNEIFAVNSETLSVLSVNFHGTQPKEFTVFREYSRKITPCIKSVVSVVTSQTGRHLIEVITST